MHCPNHYVWKSRNVNCFTMSTLQRYVSFNIHSNVFIAGEDWGHFCYIMVQWTAKYTTVYIQLYNICNNRFRNTSKPQRLHKILRDLPTGICCRRQKHSVFAQFFLIQTIYIVNMYTQQRRLCRKQREGGQNYISWRTSEPLKRWSLVGFCWCWIMWLGPATEWKKLYQRQLRRVSGLHWFVLCVVCAIEVDVCFCCCFVDARGTQDRQGHERWGHGEAPFEAGLSNLSNPILSRNPPKTSIAYIRVISTRFFQLEHI